MESAVFDYYSNVTPKAVEWLWYLPYTKGVYKLKEPTLYAEQTRLFRRRKRACEALDEHMLDCDVCQHLWEAIQAFENYPFRDDCKKRFRYRIDCNEIVCDNVRLTRKEIEEAFKKVRKLQTKTLGQNELNKTGFPENI